MDPVIGQVLQVIASVRGKEITAASENSALDQDLAIYGDEAEEFVEALCEEFGDWIVAWPWDRFIDFSKKCLWSNDRRNMAISEASGCSNGSSWNSRRAVGARPHRRGHRPWRVV
jgi:hypothetical protein